MRDLRLGIFFAVFVAAIGCNKALVADAKESPQAKIYKRSDIGSVIQGYENWKLARNDLYRVQPEVWISCIGTIETPNEILTPGDTGFIKVYVNEVGKEAMFAKAAFPVGSVIVKERHATQTAGVQFCTVMRKREKGYNPDCGDWEFTVLNKQSVPTETGALKNCMACHAKQGMSDYTFRTYLAKTKQPSGSKQDPAPDMSFSIPTKAVIQPSMLSGE